MRGFDGGRDIGFPSDSELDDIASHYDAVDTSIEDWGAADVQIERPELEQISIRLPKSDLEQLRHFARDQRVGLTTVIRMVMRDHLRRMHRTSPDSIQEEDLVASLSQQISNSMALTELLWRKVQALTTQVETLVSAYQTQMPALESAVSGLGSNNGVPWLNARIAGDPNDMSSVVASPQRVRNTLSKRLG